MNKQRRWTERSGFTLAEVLITATIMVIVIIGLVELFIYCSRMADVAENTVIAVSQAQSKLDEIRNSTYSTITTNYISGGTPGNTFNLTQITGKGVIYIDSSNSDLLQIDIVVSWRNKDGRVIGEDSNLNGVLDAGEDVNGNGRFDSPATLSGFIAKR